MKGQSDVHGGSFVCAGPPAGDRAVEHGSVAAGGDELTIRYVLAELIVYPALYRVSPKHVVTAGINASVKKRVEWRAQPF